MPNFHVECHFSHLQVRKCMQGTKERLCLQLAAVSAALTESNTSSPGPFRDTIISVSPLITSCRFAPDSYSTNRTIMGERRTHSFHMTCHVQRDYGSRMASSFISCRPNGYANTSLSTAPDLEAPNVDTTDLATASSSSGLLSPTHSKSCYSPVSRELEPTGVNNGSGVPRFPSVDTTELAEKKTTGNRPSVISIPPPLPRSSWLHNHHKDFQSPYIKTSMQGDVYNFLERPAGLKCFLYHFLVWVHFWWPLCDCACFCHGPLPPPNPPTSLHVLMQKRKTKNTDHMTGWKTGYTFKNRRWCKVHCVSQSDRPRCCVSVAVPGLLITSSFAPPPPPLPSLHTSSPSCPRIWFPVTIEEVSVACWPFVPIRHRSRSVRAAQPYRTSPQWSRSESSCMKHEADLLVPLTWPVRRPQWPAVRHKGNRNCLWLQPKNAACSVPAK